AAARERRWYRAGRCASTTWSRRGAPARSARGSGCAWAAWRSKSWLLPENAHESRAGGTRPSCRRLPAQRFGFPGVEPPCGEPEPPCVVPPWPELPVVAWPGLEPGPPPAAEPPPVPVLTWLPAPELPPWLPAARDVGVLGDPVWLPPLAPVCRELPVPPWLGLPPCCDRTRMLFSTWRTPLQLSARSSARCFIQRCSTVPCSVTSPPLTRTSMSLASMSGSWVSRSHRSSLIRASGRV